MNIRVFDGGLQEIFVSKRNGIFFLNAAWEALE
jgi:hypothetical protein